jgi:hypothetical protein
MAVQQRHQRAARRVAGLRARLEGGLSGVLGKLSSLILAGESGYFAAKSRLGHN